MQKRIQEAAQRGLDELDGGGSEFRALRNFFHALAQDEPAKKDAPVKAEAAKKDEDMALKLESYGTPLHKKDGGKK